MKKKLSKILGVALSLTLVLSLAIVFLPAPAAANPGTDYWTTFDYPLEGDDGGWVYTDEIGAVGPIAKAIDGTMYAYTGIGSAAVLGEVNNAGEYTWSATHLVSGSSSAKLTHQNQDDSVYVQFVPPAGITLGDLEALSNTWGFWYWMENTGGAVNGPQMELKFTDPDEATSFVDITVMATQDSSSPSGPPDVDAWTEVVLTVDTTYVLSYGNYIGSGFSSPAGLSLAGCLADVEGESTSWSADSWELTRVRMEQYDSDLYCYIDDVQIDGHTYDLEGSGTGAGTALGSYLMKSTDDGRSWEETDYAVDTGGSTIVAIAPSSIDADIVYVADANYVYKTEDGGVIFTYVAQDSLEDDTFVDGDNENITCLAVGYVNDEPHVYFGTANVTATNLTGHVWYIYDVAFGGDWTDLSLDGSIGACNVYGIGVSPDFDADALAVAIARESDETWVSSNYGASTTWANIEIEEGDDTSITAEEASDPLFPSDFDYDDANEVFVGITDGTGGDVYLVTDVRSYDLDVTGADADTTAIISLDLVGEIGATMLVAGENVAADVWFSDDDGETWENALGYGKPPSGTGPTYVVIDDEFETSDTPTAWAATSSSATTEGAVSLTVDGGYTFNQISLIDTDIDDVVDLSVSPAFATDDTLFMVTLDGDLDSLWRYDGSYWERVYASSVFGKTIDLVAVSPEFADDEALFVALAGTSPFIFRSTDKGQNWGPTATGLRNQPDNLNGWVIIDTDTIITGGPSNEVYKTENYGRRAWDEYAVPTGVGTVVSFALSPAFATDDTIILGDDDAQVFLSDDAGESWAIVYDAFGDAGDATYVGFDPDFATNNTIYAAANERIARYQDVTDAYCLWEQFTFEEGEELVTASGMVVSADGTVYVSDSDEDEGVQRSVNPLYDLTYVSYTEFEKVNAYVDDATVELDSLQLTSGSNVLWAVDVDNATIWAYEDTLAVQVVLTGPADGSFSARTASTTLSWEGLDSATMYEIAWDYDPDFIYAPDYDESGTTYFSLGTTAALGETIYWMVRVGTEEDAGAPVLSKWSDVRSFTVALGAAQWNPLTGTFAPAAGDDDVVLKPTFRWDKADWATDYELIFADNPDFASPLIDVTVPSNTFAVDIVLSYDTAYYWKVRAVSGTSASAWGESAFRTIPEPATVVPPVVVEPTPAPVIEMPPTITPTFIYAIIGIGAALAILVIVLIVRTRRVP